MRFFLFVFLLKEKIMMNIIKKAVSNRNVVLVALLAAASQTVLAGGFSSEATTMITNIHTGIYTIVGVVATIALLWQMVQGFSGRKTWGDIFETCLWIVGAGAAIALRQG
jgi:trbC/VIRB2 family